MAEVVATKKRKVAKLGVPDPRIVELEVENLDADLQLKAQALVKLQLESALLWREKTEYESSIDHRRIFMFTGDVSDSAYWNLVLKVGEWTTMSKEPITIVFNSPGGYVMPGLAMVDFLRGIRKQGVKVVTVSIGKTASMAGVLLQVGDERLVTPNTWLLIHEISSGAFGKFSELEDELKFTKRIQDQLLTILSDRSTLSKTEIARRWKKTDWWLNAEECVELGFADRIAETWG